MVVELKELMKNVNSALLPKEVRYKQSGGVSQGKVTETETPEQAVNAAQTHQRFLKKL